MTNYILFLFTLFVPLDNKLDTYFNFGNGLNLATFFLFILIIICISRRSGKSPFFVSSAVNLPMAVFILAMFSSLVTLYIQQGISPFSGEINFFKRFATSFIVYFLIVNIAKDKKTIKLFTYAMVIMVTVIALFTLREYRSHGKWHYSNDMRFYLAGMQPNHLGAFFAQSIPILLGFVLINKRLVIRLICLVLFMLSSSALMFTYSRGGYLALIAAFMAMGLLGKKKYLISIAAIVIMAVLFTSVMFGKGRIIPVSVKERFQSITTDEEEQDKSIKGREKVWEIARDYISQSPLIGYGYGASKYILPIDTHNMYLDIALEAGVPTLIFLFWMFITVYLVAVKTFKETDDPFYKALALGLIGSVTALIVGNMFGTRLNFFASNGYFAILLGIVAWINSDLNMGKKLTLAKNKINRVNKR